MDRSKKSKKKVSIIFVIPEGCKDENEVNDCMKMCYQECVEADLSPNWLPAAECTQIATSKHTVFVLQEFKGPTYESLRMTKSVVCGPMCMRSCITEGLPIPENKSPVFTTAMRNLIVTASQVSKTAKEDIKEKVGLMGGVYTSNLLETTTHLITNAVRSAKYERAGQMGIPAMTVEWVDAVYKESQKRNVKATDPDIIARFKCPIFLNMFVTTSNLSRKEKDEIKELITANGGTFTPQMRQQETTLLVIKEPRGDKYTHARSWGLPCVLPSYVKESVKRGYAVPSEGHLIAPIVSCSTPTKDEDIPNFTYNSEVSISVINFETSKTTIESTQLTNCTVTSSQRPKRPSGSQHAEILNNLNMSDAKKAGTFIDGCKIFLSGFTPTEGEKLTRILSLGGATVFSELTDSVSHILIGEFIVQDIKAVMELAQKPHVVTLEWLVECLKRRSHAPEEPYYCLEVRKMGPEPPSPLSQKGMQLLMPPQAELSETFKMPPPAEPVSRQLFSEFVKQNAKSPAKPKLAEPMNNTSMASTMSSQDSINPDIFNGFKFLISGFEISVTSDIESALQAAGGCVVATNFTGVADYAVVPLQTAVPNITAMEIITNLWLEECLDTGKIVDIQYYHQPLSVDANKKPLADCCISLSNYFGKEKTFLAELTQVLGATYQDVFARVAKVEKGVLPSTHLVCPKPDGQKYKAAVRWKLPAVSKHWLLACARSATKVAESPYLVSDLTDSTSVVTTFNVPSAPVDAPTPVPIQTTELPQMSKSYQTPEHNPEKLLTPQTPDIAQKPVSTTPLVAQVTPTTTPGSSVPHRSVSSLKRKSTTMLSEEHSPFHVSTPDTPYGQVFETPTAETKKRWKKFINNFPSKPVSPPPSKVPKRQSTPLSEIRRKIWRFALEEESNENINPNYTIEDMDGNQENDGELEDIPVTLNQSAQATPVRDARLSQGATPQSLSKSSQLRRVSAGRSTPTTSDFRTATATSSAQASDGARCSQIKSTETPERAKKSPANEMVCAMLGQLHRRLSTPNNVAHNLQPLPQRELVSPVEPPVSSQKPVASSLLPESQPTLIGWEDPVESAERAKVRSNSPQTASPSALQVSKPRKFVLSNVSQKELYEGKLVNVGETVLSVAMFDSQTTHLIMDEPLRSEKLLCCLAAGKWVLHTSYIDAMVKHNQYLPEEEKYEWGNALSKENLPVLNPSGIETQLANAATRWRKLLSGGNAGAFSNMKAILITGPNKYDSYKRLIEAGGGEILAPTSVPIATHCFVEANKVATMPVPLSEFVAHKVPCLLPVYLGEMLTKFPAPLVETSVIPEYRKLLM